MRTWTWHLKPDLKPIKPLFFGYMPYFPCDVVGYMPPSKGHKPIPILAGLTPEFKGLEGTYPLHIYIYINAYVYIYIYVCM